VIVVLLNIFFGIIIDTFGKLRNLKVEREDELLNKCFICGASFEEVVSQSPIGEGSSMLAFRTHREERHNLWHYLCFVLHIWHQSRDQDSSLEMFVRASIEREDVAWFPSGHTAWRSLQSQGEIAEKVSRPTFEPAGGPTSATVADLRSELEGLKADFRTMFARLERL
jgi:inositol 1,4,5-triphosphate receptor type 1